MERIFTTIGNALSALATGLFMAGVAVGRKIERARHRMKRVESEDESIS